jgi:hypothetical protein
MQGDAKALRKGDRMMRNAMLAILALLSAGAATMAGPTPAAAFDYPWCYRTYGQCMASASGRGLYCNINPRVAFGRQQRGRYYRDY